MQFLHDHPQGVKQAQMSRQFKIPWATLGILLATIPTIYEDDKGRVFINEEKNDRY